MDQDTTYIYGIHPVLEALKKEKPGVEKVFVRDGMKSQKINEIYEAASSKRVPVKSVPGSKLFELVGKVNDQGVVAELSQVSYQDFDEWLAEADLSANPIVLLLDEIEDTHNFGAILRSAAAAGAAAVIVPKHRQAPVNATVYKTSAGTAGMVPIIRVTNLNQTVYALKDNGFWIAALDAGGNQDIWDATFDRPMGLIIGSEGQGIRKKTLELSDFKLRIPMSNNVESLNASVSAALLMYEILRQKSR